MNIMSSTDLNPILKWHLCNQPLSLDGNYWNSLTAKYPVKDSLHGFLWKFCLHLLRSKIRLIMLLSPSPQSFTYSFQLSLTKAAKHIKMSSVWNLSYLRKENPLHIVQRMLLHCTIPRSKPIGDFQNVQILKDWLNTIENNWWAYTDLDPVAWIWPSVYFGDSVLKFNQKESKIYEKQSSDDARPNLWLHPSLQHPVNKNWCQQMKKKV